MFHAVIFSLVGPCNSTKLALHLIRDASMHRGNVEGFTVRTGLVGGCFLHTGDDGVFRAGLQVGELAAFLPVIPIVYGILPFVILRHFNIRMRSGNQFDDRNVPLIHMAAAAGEVKRFVLGHLTEKLPFVICVFQLELNRVNEVGRVSWICFMFATRVFAKLRDIDGFIDRDNNRPDTILHQGLISRKAAGQLAVLFALVGRCADAGDQIVWNFDVFQSCCQIKCWRAFLRQCRRWEQTYNHDKAE